MKKRYEIIYLISGVFIGVVMMWMVQDKGIHLSGHQLESLSMGISNNVNSYLSRNSSMAADKDYMQSAYSTDSNDELVARIKSEVAALLIDVPANKNVSALSANTVTEQLASDKTIADDAYNKAKYLLEDVVNGQPLSFSQFASRDEISSLSPELKNRIFDEVAVKLNNGELDADTFIGKND